MRRGGSADFWRRSTARGGGCASGIKRRRLPDLMLESALVLASKGIPVFPVRLCRVACLKCNTCKAPASPHGFHDATLDAEGIHTLWKQHPGQLIGVPTGKISNFDVLDLDS